MIVGGHDDILSTNSSIDQFQHTEGSPNNHFQSTVTDRMSTKDMQVTQTNMLLDPFSLYQRRTDRKSLESIRYPVNPIICAESSKLPQKKPVLPFHEFCRQRSIPFSENEDRFYKLVKQKYLLNAYKQAVNTTYNAKVSKNE